MPLPASRTVTGTYTNPVTGAPATGTVILSPVPPVWTDTDGNQVLAGGTTITLVNGAFSQELVPTDTPAVFPTNGKLWRIEQRLTGLPYLVERFELVTGAAPIDITDLVKVDQEPPPFLPEGTAGGDLTGSYPSPQLRNWQTGRDHLGLGDSATRNVGVDFGEVADGEPNVLSTGLVSGGGLSVSATPQALDIAATVGYVVDYFTTPLTPTVTRVSEPAQTVALDAGALTRSLTWWLLDSTGAVVQQATEPTRVQRRTHIVLGFTVLDVGSQTLFLAKAVPVPLAQIINQMVDFMDAVGVFSESGNVISANGTNLKIDTSGGGIFARGFDHDTDPNDPHIRLTAAQSPAQFRRATSTTTAFAAPVTDIDPANYDNSGVLTAVPGGANTSTVQRVFLFAQDNAEDQLVVQYGQATYSSLAAAEAAISSQPFTVNPAFIGTLIGFIVVTKTATNLSDPSQAKFIAAPQFGSGAGGASSSTGTDTVGATRLVSKTADESVTSSTTMQNDDHLHMSVSSGGVYAIDMFIDADADPAADLALGFTFPSGATISWTELGPSLGNANNIASPKLNRNTDAGTSTIGLIAAGTVACPRGVLRVGATSGTLQFQWAQAVADATPTVLRTGSWLKLSRIA